MIYALRDKAGNICSVDSITETKHRLDPRIVENLKLLIIQTFLFVFNGIYVCTLYVHRERKNYIVV